MSELPDPLALLRLEPAGPARYTVALPDGSPDGGNVVYGGQLMAQLIMASAAEAPDKYLKSMSTTFSRAGSYGAPIELHVDGFHSGRTWASGLVTAYQGGKLLTRAMVLLTADEPDVIAHPLEPPAAGVGKPDDGEPG
jgi:acyl-CoA thioesterase-2